MLYRSPYRLSSSYFWEALQVPHIPRGLWKSDDLTMADFGSWRPYILIVQTLIGVAIGFAWLSVHSAKKWEYAAALYIVGCKSLVIAVAKGTLISFLLGCDYISDFLCVLPRCVRYLHDNEKPIC